MKKLLTILAAAIIVSVPVFAGTGKSADVQLVTEIEETAVSYQLAYEGTVIADQTTDKDIAVAPITADGSTGNFTVIASSNLNNDLTVTVNVVPESFVTTLNGGTENFDSKITPKVNTDTKINILTAGKHVDLLVNKFNLSWKGNADLPAGDYVSNVKITYSIN
ncbi:MAG: hypothetical protein ACPKOI_08215 [Pleomorphochaeta sp.]